MTQNRFREKAKKKKRGKNDEIWHFTCPSVGQAHEASNTTAFLHKYCPMQLDCGNRFVGQRLDLYGARHKATTIPTNSRGKKRAFLYL